MSRPRRRSCLATLLIMAVAGCGGNGDVGEACETISDCSSGLQCFDGTCVPQCERHADCGDGHTCDLGVCHLVESSIGESCDREVDCGPGQACHLDGQDIDGDGLLTASCQLEVSGAVLDAPCTVDDDCRTGTCVIGRCVDLCDLPEGDDPRLHDTDCPAGHACARVPRELSADEVAAFGGCLPDRGNIVYPVPFDVQYQRFFLPVPDTAVSLALVSSIEDPTQLVGAARLESPSGELLYQLPLTRDEYFQNRVRHEPSHGVSTLLLPQTVDAVAPLEAGAYVVELGSYLDLETPGTEIPTVNVIYRLTDDALHLDVHFYFLELADHPCASAFGSPSLDAASAQGSVSFQRYVDELKLIFNNKGIVFEADTATYEDIGDRPDLDGLSEDRLGDLLALSTTDGGVNVFFVRSLSPTGLQALSGGPPSPPGVAGTRASGVAIGLETLCYRSWDELARITAHEIARSLGLPRNVEPDGYTDAIDDDSGEVSRDNLMFYSEFAGQALNAGQTELLKLSPAMR